VPRSTLVEDNKANSSVPESTPLEDRKTVSAVPTPTLLEFRKAGSIVPTSNFCRELRLNLPRQTRLFWRAGKPFLECYPRQF
jgi:hypothetical protein